MMRIAIFSDVHGNLTALEAVLEDIQGQSVDEVYFAGDLCVFGPRPAACLHRLQELKLTGVYGNTDEWLVRPPLLPENATEAQRTRLAQIEWTQAQLNAADLAWLLAMPFGRRISPTADARDDLLIVHANPVDVNQLIFPPVPDQLERYGKLRQSDEELEPLLGGVQAAVIAYGHLHIPNLRPWKMLLLANISSVSLPGDGDPRAKYAVLTWRAGHGWTAEHHRVAYAVESEIEAFRLAQPPGWQASVESLQSTRMVPQRV